MSNVSLLTPWVLILIGLLTAAVYVLALALRTINRLANRLSETNKQLLVLVGYKEGGSDAARALIASAKVPRKDLPGISAEVRKKKSLKEADKKGLGFSIEAKVP